MNSPTTFDSNPGGAEPQPETSVSAFEGFIAVLRKHQGKIAIVGADLMLAMLSYCVAVNLFRDINGVVWAREVLAATLGVLLAARLAGILAAGLENTSLRYPSPYEVLRVIRGVALGSAVFLVLCRFAHFRHELPA